MSKRLHPRRRKHANAAREVLVESFELPDRVLVIEDLPLADQLQSPFWSRYRAGTRGGAEWPEPGHEAATLRLPRSKGALDLCVHGAASVLPEGAPLWLYGANDEGIRSAPKRLHGLFTVEHNVAKRHSRVFSCRRTSAAPKPLEAWQTKVPAPAGIEGRWIAYPGVFAKGRLDAGTATLLDALPDLPAGAAVLDFACGIGVVTGWLHARQPDARYTALDNDALALRACAHNIPGCLRVLSDGWTELAPARFDYIVSNPPFHAGKDEDFGVLRALIAEAPRFLRASGELWLVCQRQVPVGRLFADHPLGATAVASTPRFTVWKAQR